MPTELQRKQSAARFRAYADSHPELMRDYDRMTRHGLTWERFSALTHEQGDACFLCKRPLLLLEGTARQKPQIDHDHSLGCHPSKGSCDKCRRKMLCVACNLMVGMVESLDSVYTLLDYISLKKELR